MPIPTPAVTMAATSARLTNTAYGGKDGLAIDRRLWRTLTELHPTLPALAHQYRQLAHRAVATIATDGVAAIIDIGCGLPDPDPTRDTHHVAASYGTRPAQPRVVYIDNDPIVASHRRARSAIPDRTATIHADIRDTRTILHTPEITDILTARCRVGILMHNITQYLDNATTQRIINAVTAPLPPGSWISLMQPTITRPTPQTTDLLTTHGWPQLHWRTHTHLKQLMRQWRPRWTPGTLLTATPNAHHTHDAIGIAYTLYTTQ